MGNYEADLHVMTRNGFRNILLSESKLKDDVFNMISFL